MSDHTQDPGFPHTESTSTESPLTRFDSYKELEKTLMHYITTNREKLVAAWLAETGLMPSESMIVQKWDNEQFKMWIEKRTDKEKL